MAQRYSKLHYFASFQATNCTILNEIVLLTALFMELS